jgi:hypothetical protein
MHEYYAWDKDYGFYGLKEDRKTIDRYETKHLVVSTVFLGLDHSFEGSPILFETLVSGGNLEGEMARYHTWEEAIKGHNNMMKLCGIEIKETKKKETNNIIDNRFDILDL